MSIAWDLFTPGAALAGGLVAGNVYKTAAGAMMVVY
jgi:hypothetical protein